MTTSVNIVTADHAAKVVLGETEQTVQPNTSAVFHVYDDVEITISEIKDDSPHD